MEKLFQHNGWLKIFSAALAVLLWAMVMPTYMADTTRTFDVPLTVVKHPTLDLISGPDERLPSYVQVRVEGRNLVVSRLKKEDFRATVDYSKVQEPNKQTQIEVKLEGPVNPQAFYTVSPKTISVMLVQNKEAPFPVSAEPRSGIVTVGARDYRYTAKTAEQIKVKGRADLLSRVNRARVPLEPKDLTSKPAQVTRLAVPVDAAGEPVERLEGTEITVDLTWEELGPGKSFKIQPATRGALPPGYSVTGLDADPASVVIRADSVKGKLPDIDGVATAPIDLTGRTKSFSATVNVIPPPGTTASTETVTVNVSITESTVEKVFRGVPIKVRNQPVGSEVTLAAPTVQFTAAGPYSILTPLDASAFSVFVDVDGLRDGRHMLPLRFTQPAGLTNVMVEPSAIEVTILTHQ